MVATPMKIYGDALYFDNILGTTGDDIVYAFDGGSIIEGGAGADIIFGDDTGGLEFTDTASYEHSLLGVKIDLRVALQHGGDAEGDRLYSIENIVGSAQNDSISGDSGANVLNGGAGLDVLNGGDGDDTLIGGVDGKADILDGGAGVDVTDFSDAGGGMTISLEQTTVFVTQFGAFTRTVDGSATLNAGSAGATPVLESIIRKIENVIGTSFDDTITGNSGDNVIMGGMGADVISGGNGNDTASYTGLDASGWFLGVQVDLMQAVQHGGDAEGDRLFSIENISSGYGNDNLSGNNSGNRLESGQGADTIYGRGGADTIIGGAGSDSLDGGTGVDTFVYLDANTYARGGGGRYHYNRNADGTDIISNFETGVDKIDLRDIDANRLVAGNDAFVFVDAFSGSAGQLMLGGGLLSGDINGDGIADLTINVAGAVRSDILL